MAVKAYDVVVVVVAPPVGTMTLVELLSKLLIDSDTGSTTVLVDVVVGEVVSEVEKGS